MIGMVTGGTMNGSLIGGFSRTGRLGTIIDIGRDEEPGGFKAIDLHPKNRDKI